MAVGDLFWFDHHVPVGGSTNIISPSSGDQIYLGINTTAGVTNTTTQGWDSYTEASTGHLAGGYPSSGTFLTDWSSGWSYSGKVATFDSTVAPNYTQSSLHSTNATFAIGYNQTDPAAPTLFAIDLGGVDMTAGDLTITFNASGIATITST